MFGDLRDRAPPQPKRIRRQDAAAMSRGDDQYGGDGSEGGVAFMDTEAHRMFVAARLRQPRFGTLRCLVIRVSARIRPLKAAARSEARHRYASVAGRCSPNPVHRIRRVGCRAETLPLAKWCHVGRSRPMITSERHAHGYTAKAANVSTALVDVVDASRRLEEVVERCCLEGRRRRVLNGIARALRVVTPC